jgi:hypothetical protein
MTTPIKYGVYDGFPVRFTSDGEIWVCYDHDGKWHREVSHIAKLICYDIGVLTEQAYHRNFGHRDLPPLPPDAFTSDPWERTADRRGWLSPLV